MDTAPEIKLVVDDPLVSNVLDLLGFPTLFDIHPSVYEAVEAFLGDNT